MSKNEIKSAGIPVRIRMKTRRYEVAASLFDAVFHQQYEPMNPEPEQALLPQPEPLSPAEELLMGIMQDDLSDDGFFVKPSDPDVIRGRGEEEDPDGIEELELISEGEMTRLRDPATGEETVTVAYDESELTGMEGSRTTIIFRTDDETLVNMIRSGEVNTALTFKPHHRAICTYETPFMPFQIGIHSLVVDNRLLEDGTLVLDYIIEIRGARAERSRMEMHVEPM